MIFINMGLKIMSETSLVFISALITTSGLIAFLLLPMALANYYVYNQHTIKVMVDSKEVYIGRKACVSVAYNGDTISSVQLWSGPLCMLPIGGSYTGNINIEVTTNE